MSRGKKIRTPIPTFDRRKYTRIMNRPNTRNVFEQSAVCLCAETTDLLYCRSIDRYLIGNNYSCALRNIIMSSACYLSCLERVWLMNLNHQPPRLAKQC